MKIDTQESAIFFKSDKQRNSLNRF